MLFLLCLRCLITWLVEGFYWTAPTWTSQWFTLRSTAAAQGGWLQQGFLEQDKPAMLPPNGLPFAHHGLNGSGCLPPSAPRPDWAS